MKKISDVLEESLNRIKKLRHFTTWSNYQTTARLVLKLMNCSDMNVIGIDEDFILLFVDRLRQRGDCDNTINFHLRNLRALVHDELSDISPFRIVSTNPQKTRKRSLTPKQLHQFLEFETCSMKQDLAKDVFRLMLLLDGTAWVDIAFMPRVAFAGDRLEFCRHKTGVQVKVPLNDVSRTLVTKYLSKDESSPYLFNFMDNISDDIKRFKRYKAVMRQVNTGLRQISKKLSFLYNLTAYCARHTFASVALASGNRTEDIKTCMGHTSSQTTELYLRQLDHTVERRVNESVVDFIAGKSENENTSKPASLAANLEKIKTLIVKIEGNLATTPYPNLLGQRSR